MSLIDNRKAYFDYEVMETLEAGVRLLGYEVKSLKKKQGSLLGSYILINEGKASLINSFIPPYQENNTPKDYNPKRKRDLLLSKKEIKRLSEIDKKLTIVPISMYNKGSHIKVEIAIVRGKKKFDKRRTIEKRETNRDMERVMKERR